MNDIFLRDSKAAFSRMVKSEERKALAKKEVESKANEIQADDLIPFRQLSKKTVGGDADDYEYDVVRATGAGIVQDDFVSKLSRITQLTGFSDPVYAEAVVTVQQFDIVLDVLVVNQTTETLQNLTCEFATLGDLKLVERPTPQTLGPHAFFNTTATIKVSSTETGVIFGTVSFDKQGASDSSVNIVLNDLHLDLLWYIRPSSVSEAAFRSMWTEFEWENKVAVNSPGMTDLRAYLDHLLKSTNMQLLTPPTALEGECSYLSANLAAQSLFGEDALANVSIELSEDGTLQGHVRIRSKTQGIALSLGDKITISQKALKA